MDKQPGTYVVVKYVPFSPPAYENCSLLPMMASSILAVLTKYTPTECQERSCHTSVDAQNEADHRLPEKVATTL